MAFLNDTDGEGMDVAWTTNTPYTIMCWYYPTTTPSSAGIGVVGAGSASAAFDTAGFIANTYTLECRVNGANSVSGSTLTVNTWNHITLARTGVTTIFVYRDGSLNITGPTTDVTARSVDTLFAGWYDLSTNTRTCHGRYAAIKAWTTNLSQSQIQREMYSIVPLEYGNLWDWWPCFPGDSERLRAYGANGYDMTELGTLSDEAGPPVPWGIYSTQFPMGIGAVGVDRLSTRILRPVENRQAATIAALQL